MASRAPDLVDRPLPRAPAEVSGGPACPEALRQAWLTQWRAPHGPQVSSSAFAFLFAEVVKYSQDRVQRISDLERKCGPLCSAGLGSRADLTRHPAPRLENLGHGVGARALELTAYREHATKREIRLIQALQVRRGGGRQRPRCPSHGAQFVAYTLWKHLFGVNADSLEKSTQQDDECARGRPRRAGLPRSPPPRRPRHSHDFRAWTAHDTLHLGATRHGPAQLRGFRGRRHPRRPARRRPGERAPRPSALRCPPAAGCSPGAARQPCTVSAHFVDHPGGDHDKTVYLIKFEPQVMRRESRLG